MALSTWRRTAWQWLPGGRVLFIIELGLDEFQVPVAELVPDELVKDVGRLIEVVGVQRLPGLPDDLLEAAHDPGLHRGQGFFVSVSVSVAGRGRGSKPSRFMKVKRQAFQTLLAKLR